MADARIKLSIVDGTFEIEGPEEFVSKRLEAFGGVIEGVLAQGQTRSRIEEPANQVSQGTNRTDSGDYSSVYEVHDGVVNVLIDIPGEGKKEKAINAGLIGAFANATDGVDTITFDEVREICKQHSCLDPNNFAAQIQSERAAFLIGGSARKKTIKLTVPGKKQAKSLIKSLAI